MFQLVNKLLSAVKLDILIWKSMEIDSLLEPASSGHSRNCSFHFFAPELLLGFGGNEQKHTELH